MSLVYLILGGNRGNRPEIFSSAIKLLNSEIGPQKAISSLYESESWGFESELFLNQVIIIETPLSPFEVLLHTQQIESQLGRVRNREGYEPRTIDIDLLYYGSQVINSSGLTIPHPRIAKRKFVLVPLAEIAPNLKDPVTGMTVTGMLQKCNDTSKVWLFTEN
ncbi:MAG: 2-amino-4-hydroxy-6-hydroxymethyldihydropteridine diphosphokinase [Bacteroidetes bacterium]|nr:2-amino-4-hydroxy-6-hydroxymethyldihydropteridine diphosphokinase [Bacteroidota bacterium]MCL6103445.1 2-amino-4-hydroxy-6-hydroxymethyldihydropteridine diphosphokinase [Bacteroidota bacterium]